MRSLPASAFALPLLLLGACSSEPKLATVRVESDPPGGLVTIDGKGPGKPAPAEFALTTTAEHDVRVTLDGFVPFERRLFQIEPGLRVVATLNPSLALHVVSDPPGATVTHKGKLVLAATPGDVTMQAGESELRMALEGFVPVEFTGSVQAGQREWNVTLERASFVQVESTPPGLAIFVDRRDTNAVTPARVLVGASKPHELVVCLKDACTPAQKSAAAAPGDGHKLTFQWVEPRER